MPAVQCRLLRERHTSPIPPAAIKLMTSREPTLALELSIRPGGNEQAGYTEATDKSTAAATPHQNLEAPAVKTCSPA